MATQGRIPWQPRGDTTYHEVFNGAVENGVVIVTIATMTDEVLTSHWNLSQQMSSVHWYMEREWPYQVTV